jgi:hypothetical protein
MQRVPGLIKQILSFSAFFIFLESHGHGPPLHFPLYIQCDEVADLSQSPWSVRHLFSFEKATEAEPSYDAEGIYHRFVTGKGSDGKVLISSPSVGIATVSAGEGAGLFTLNAYGYWANMRSSPKLPNALFGGQVFLENVERSIAVQIERDLFFIPKTVKVRCKKIEKSEVAIFVKTCEAALAEKP